MDVSIRVARERDARPVRDLHVASIQGLGGVAYSADQVEAWAHERDPRDYPISSTETHVLVAERDGRIVGFGWMKPDADDYFEVPVDGEITAVYVHPSVASRGVGSRLYEGLERYARDEDLATLGLWASRNAVEFYRSHGYDRVTEHVIDFHDGVTGRVVEMWKALE